MRSRTPDDRTHLSLRSKLVIGGVLILLVPMTIIGSATFIKSSRTLEHISSLQLVQVVESISGMIQITLEKDLRNLNTIPDQSNILQKNIRREAGLEALAEKGRGPAWGCPWCMAS